MVGIFGGPLVRFDFGTLHAKYRDETEADLRAAPVATEPLVLNVPWIDEIGQAIVTAPSVAHAESRTVDGALLLGEIRGTRPPSTMMREQVAALRLGRQPHHAGGLKRPRGRAAIAPRGILAGRTQVAARMQGAWDMPGRKDSRFRGCVWRGLAAAMCTRHGQRGWSAVALLAAQAAAAGIAAEPRMPPAPHCLDARAVTEFHQVDDRTLLLLDASGARRRVVLARDCPALTAGPGVRVLARAGWLCGAGGESVRSDADDCAVARVAVIDAATWSDLRRATTTTLAPVTVRGRRAHGFRGSPDFCVPTRGLRGWQETPEGLTVEVSPRHTGGHRRYRIETAGGCADMTNAETLALRSGMDLGMVCGHPGDRVVFARGQPSALGAGGDARFARPQMQSALAQRSGCQVVRVYPIDPR